MAQELQPALRLSLPAVDFANPNSIHALPQWVATRLATVSKWGEETEIDGVRVPTIPTSSTLTGEIRAALERRCVSLESAGIPGPANEMVIAVGKMVRFYAASRSSDATFDVKIDVYMQALRDLPTWAVTEAIARWYRAETGASEESYRFAPAPGELRQIAQRIASAAAGQIVSLRRLLEARPMDSPLITQQTENAGLIEAERKRRASEVAEERRRAEHDAELRDAEKRKHWRSVAERLEADSSQPTTPAQAAE